MLLLYEVSETPWYGFGVKTLFANEAIIYNIRNYELRCQSK